MSTKTMERARVLLDRLRHLDVLYGVLYYDRWTACTPEGFDYEAEAEEQLGLVSNELLCGPEGTEVTKELAQFGEGDFSSDIEQGIARRLLRLHDEATKIPADLLAELARANADGQRQWAECRANEDFASFLPVLKRQFDLQARIAEALVPGGRAYDTILSRCDPSYTTDELDRLFEPVKQVTRDLLTSTRAAWGAVDTSELERVSQDVPGSVADELVSLVPASLGANPARIHPWTIHHPVTVCLGPRDARPSSYPTGEAPLFQRLLAMAHETGHAQYGSGASDEVVAAGLWDGIPGFMHESQSRLFENHVWRSEEYWTHELPVVAERVPELAGLSPRELVRFLNKPKPGVSRLEADELTYPLHILIRYEIERDYFDGKLALGDIEDAWNDKYESYLGVRPAKPSEGVLSDVHWASGCVGYFFSYLLGDMYAAQFVWALNKDVPDAFPRLAQGDPRGITGWLSEHVWQLGQTYTAPETLLRATGEPLNPEHYVRHLRDRFEI